MGLMTIDVRCAEESCGAISPLLVDRDQRNDPQECPECGGKASRTMSVPNVTRASYVDGTRRFDSQRQRQQLRKEKAAAQARGDFASEKKIKSEMNKIK